MSKSHYIIEDVYNIYSSIHEETDSETIEEIDNFAGDVYATIASSMLHEGYSASGILGFLSTAADEEILERFGDFNEDLITESTISEEYVNEQVEQLDEFVGGALKILGSGLKAAKFAKGAKGLAPLSRIGQGLQGAGRAASRVAKQGPRASSVVRAGLSKLKGAATAGLKKLKSGVAKVGGAIQGAVKKTPIGRIAQAVIPGAVGFALGRGTSGGDKSAPPKSDKDPGRSSAPSAGAAPTQPRGNAVASRQPAAPAAPKKDRMAGASKEDRMAAFAKANPKLAARQAERDRTRGTNQTTNPLMKDMKAGLPDPKPKASAASNAVKSSEKKQSRLDKALSGVTAVKKGEDTKKESYDIVLDYLISEGHAESVEEAHYIMLRLEADHVQEIVESAS